MIATLVCVAPAVAGNDPGPASKQLWHMTALDQAASEIAGFPVEVDASDSIAEWTTFAGYGPDEVTGFTYVTANPGAQMYNPYDGYYHDAYHHLYLSPSIYATFHTNLAQANPTDAAVALLTLDHEAQHQKLHSGDESRVNACALADLPGSRPGGSSPTTIQNVQVPQSYRAKLRYRTKVHGRWVWRLRYVNRVRYVSQSQTVANPAYTAVLNAAHDIYIHQPAPYNAGTC